MIEFLPLLGTAFLAGLLGSAHCLGMCAGIAGVVAIGRTAAGGAAGAATAVTFNAGRVLSYALLGAVIGGFGSALVAAMPALAGPVRLAGGLLIVLIGLSVALRWRLLAPLENAGLAVWRLIQPLASRLLPVTSLPRALGLGLSWGFLPCGLVYSVLMLAATAASPAGGALAMLAFGIGTMPAMVLTGLGALRLAAVAGRGRRASGVAIVLLGIATLAMPLATLLPGSDTAHPHHHAPTGR